MALVRDRAIYWLEARVRKINRNLEEDSQSLELTGEYVHYKTDEGFEKAQDKLEILTFLLNETKKNRPD